MARLLISPLHIVFQSIYLHYSIIDYQNDLQNLFGHEIVSFYGSITIFACILEKQYMFEICGIRKMLTLVINARQILFFRTPFILKNSIDANRLKLNRFSESIAQSIM